MLQRLTQKYTIVQLLEEMPESAEYDWREWPLHVTIADIFAIDWSAPTMVEKLSQLASAQPSFSTTAIAGLCLGEKGVPVMLLDQTKELRTFHMAVVNMLESGNARFNTPQYIKEGWLPHSTIQHGVGLTPGEKVTFQTLTLIDMFPDQNGHRRKILKTISFGLQE